MYYVYVLECTDFRKNVTYYTGYTNDLTTRLLQHSGKISGGAKYVRNKKINLHYYEEYYHRGTAMKREREIKKYSHKKKKKLPSLNFDSFAYEANFL